MTKVVINKCFGGFGLSEKAVERYFELKGWNIVRVKSEYSLIRNHFYINEEKDENFFADYSVARDDPDLIKVIEELGSEADGYCAELKIVEIPDGVDWAVEEYDGREWIAEVHKTWG